MLTMSPIRGLIVGGIAAAMLTLTSVAAQAGCCEAEPACCEPAPVCCAPPPPVEVTWCVKDPCDCCTYEVTACLPACCAGEVPCLSGWRKGILGRKVLTYEFPGCGHCVEVVISPFGKAFAR
jgi:hypothetical protein